MIWLIRYIYLNISFAIAFGKKYNELYPGTIYSPRFSIDTYNAFNCIYLPPPMFLYLKNIGTLCGFQ